MIRIPTKTSQGVGKPLLLLVYLLSLCLVPGLRLHAETSDAVTIELKLGDYRFSPREVQLAAGTPAVLRLTNTDGMTPHNFTLEIAEIGVAVDVDVHAGDTADVELQPLPAGRYPFHCNKKLPFMKSHREKGMEGVLVVTD